VLHCLRIRQAEPAKDQTGDVGLLWKTGWMVENPAAMLRDLLFMPLVSGRHVDITQAFADLGLDDANPDGTKAERVNATLHAASLDTLTAAAEKLLSAQDNAPEPRLRNRLQDVLFANRGPEIWEKTRRKIAASLDIEDLVTDPDRFEKMLDQWWILGSRNPFNGIFGGDDDATVGDLLFGPTKKTTVLREEIDQHVFRNPDWSAETLFEALGCFEASNWRFASFLEDLVSHQVIVDEDQQRHVVEAITPHLRETHLELREVDIEGGYPVFRLVPTGNTPSRPKSVIFASTRRLDLRISSTLDNEVEVVDEADALVYDEPIGPDGLTWADLQQWWMRHHPEQDPDAAKKALYARLARSVPATSPPQRRLFRLYYLLHAERIHELPALLPEVLMHWDHKTVRERGVAALLGQRMDFLLLPPNNHRVVLEVDGISHYIDERRRPSPSRYADNVRLDRDLRLRGYDVFRFGGAELQSDDDAALMLADFFAAIFDRCGIKS
jgi:very-short-patch-repair endonuclease